jgi:hypothetical protein
LLLIYSDSAVAYKREYLTAAGSQPVVLNPQDIPTQLYEKSYALVISNSEYKYWDKLPFAGQELDGVTTALRNNGFNVLRLSDLNTNQMRNEISEFFQSYGRQKESRIIFYYSGHGFLDKETDDGYLVPVDAQRPGPQSNILVKAIPMEDVRNAAMRMTAVNGLFIFDNCFSGMVFKSDGVAPQPESRSSSNVDRWRVLRNGSQQRGRQFIAAGGRGEILPSRSPVASAFIQGLTGAASIARDGYVTAAELAFFIQNNATTRMQTPRYLPLGGFTGDMVFQSLVAPSAVASSKPTYSGAKNKGVEGKAGGSSGRADSSEEHFQHEGIVRYTRLKLSQVRDLLPQRIFPPRPYDGPLVSRLEYWKPPSTAQKFMGVPRYTNWSGDFYYINVQEMALQSVRPANYPIPKKSESVNILASAVTENGQNLVVIAQWWRLVDGGNSEPDTNVDVLRIRLDDKMIVSRTSVPHEAFGKCGKHSNDGMQHPLFPDFYVLLSNDANLVNIICKYNPDKNMLVVDTTKSQIDVRVSPINEISLDLLIGSATEAYYKDTDGVKLLLPDASVRLVSTGRGALRAANGDLILMAWQGTSENTITYSLHRGNQQLIAPNSWKVKEISEMKLLHGGYAARLLNERTMVRLVSSAAESGIRKNNNLIELVDLASGQVIQAITAPFDSIGALVRIDKNHLMLINGEGKSAVLSVIDGNSR